MADQAMSDLDIDGDGKLSMQELKRAPGLKYNAKQLDTDGDGNLSRAEIQARIQTYQEMRVGLTSFSCNVAMGNRSLAGARVRLVPEPFLQGIIGPLESTSQQDGRVDFMAEGLNVSVVPVGMYRVEITSPNVQIPAAYNTNTTLGLEVSATTDTEHPSPIVFYVKK